MKLYRKFDSTKKNFLRDKNNNKNGNNNNNLARFILDLYNTVGDSYILLVLIIKIIKIIIIIIIIIRIMMIMIIIVIAIYGYLRLEIEDCLQWSQSQIPRVWSKL